MTLTVENGTGLETADAYIDVAFLDSYLSSHGKTVTGSTDQKEQHIRKATAYMVQAYYGMWKGYRIRNEQSLDWPRELVLLDDAYYAEYVANNIVPVQVKQACAELAYRDHVSGDLMPDLTQQVKREKVDVLEVEYDNTSPQTPRYPAVTRILKPLLMASASGNMGRLNRV